MNNKMQMKERYPFLAHWKKTGLNKFPTYYSEEILQGIFTYLAEERLRVEEEDLRKNFRNYFDQSPTFRWGLKSREEAYLLENSYIEAMRAELVQKYWSSFEQRIEDEIERKSIDAGQREMQAYRDIIKGEDRGQVIRDFVSPLPNSQGGKTLFTKDQKVILKCVYLEFQECIEKIRRICDIPLRDNHDYPWGYMDESEGIIMDIPDWEVIFKKSELPLITEYSSISDVSLEIISERLKACPLRKPSPRTLQNILDKVTSL